MKKMFFYLAVFKKSKMLKSSKFKPRIQRHDFAEEGVSFGKRHVTQISHSYKLPRKSESWEDTNLGMK